MLNDNDSDGEVIDIPEPSQSLHEESSEAKSKEFDSKENAERERLKNEDYKQDIDARKEYASKLYRLITYWLFGIGLIIFLQGLHISFEDGFSISFSLSDKVIIAILTGTTINVLGLFLVVARYFFKSSYSD